jgi:hypothetical protein
MRWRRFWSAVIRLRRFRKVDDSTVPHGLEFDDPPSFYPTLEDADRIGLPLLCNL